MLRAGVARAQQADVISVWSRSPQMVTTPFPGSGIGSKPPATDLFQYDILFPSVGVCMIRTLVFRSNQFGPIQPCGLEEIRQFHQFMSGREMQWDQVRSSEKSRPSVTV